ncbi:hypothetical protein IMG5_165430 [Ichthyophthirius multifiliis]|uniref:Peptidase S49 domain-containing protein n=1 Tax=Ichthyophthirius multifiliis TaxID=5932 RepID=G0R0L2_ICHMU|nr:hypothetical protein IMG5_165430 [Ichthyophthirius multifiliis]EGR28998.1 hypothetical protein IMG5_165430 [Ichthyophthirius multifiliis]|eukprot:XP_004030234.1 hypothetical protein IMG5_165430 [Ichthyophthirius multifiliis]
MRWILRFKFRQIFIQVTKILKNMKQGDNVYANPGSFIGNISETLINIDASEFLKQNNIENREVYSNNKATGHLLNWRKSNNEEGKQNQLNYVEFCAEKVFNDIKNQRGDKLKADYDQALKVHTSSQALNLGLIDNIGTYESILIQKFPLANIKYSGHSRFSMLSNYQQDFKNKKLIPISFLIGLFGLKIIIKYLIILKVIQTYLFSSSQQ